MSFLKSRFNRFSESEIILFVCLDFLAVFVYILDTQSQHMQGKRRMFSLLCVAGLPSVGLSVPLAFTAGLFTGHRM